MSEDQELQPEQGTEYEMREVQNTGHEHTFTKTGTDEAGWEIWECSCGAGYGKPSL
jgi:hypothetical protein